MEIEILEQQCGGTEFVPRPPRLHLGAQNAEGVDRLQFILPEAWAECTMALYLRRSDGVQLAAIPLDTDGSVTVDRRLTGSVRGQWMLAAMGSGGYTAYTRPGSYDVYATLPTDGGSEELPPSAYEQFVARVLENALAAAASARRAENGAADTAVQAALAQKAADKILADRTDADACAKRAEAAALRAESFAPTGGQVLSVNGKGGAVQLTARDVAAVPTPAQPLPGEVVRILGVDAATGAVQTDTTALPDLRPYVHRETVPTAETPGAVRADGRYGVAVRTDATLTTVPATAAQLDRMTEAYAPLTPALLPYGVKKALTSAAGAANWSAQEKATALLQLGADDRFYSKAEADRKFGNTLRPATAAVLGGVKVGRSLTVSADGTLEMTAKNLDTVLGFSLAEKLNQLGGVTDMNGKLVYTSAGAAGKSDKTLTVPDEVDYIVVRMAIPLECTTITSTGSAVAAAAAAEYGSTRIARGGTAVAMVGGGKTYNLRGGIYCKGEALVRVSFAANGTVSIGAANQEVTTDGSYPFNVEGYRYV